MAGQVKKKIRKKYKEADICCAESVKIHITDLLTQYMGVFPQKLHNILYIKIPYGYFYMALKKMIR